VKTKIERLSSEQEAEVSVWRDRYWDIGTCTDPIDRAKAADAISRMYGFIGKEQPIFVWCESPFTSSLAVSVLRSSLSISLWDSLQDSLRDSLWDSLWDSLSISLQDSLSISLWDSLWDSLQDSLSISLRDSLQDSLQDSLSSLLRSSLRDSLRDSLWDSLQDSLSISLRDSLWDSLRDSLRDSLPDLTVWGSAVWWLCFYRFCGYIGVRYSEEAALKLALYEQFACSAFWAWPYAEICIVSARPNCLRWTKKYGVLHCDGGPAVQFRDGWTLWYLNGVRVPQWLAETKDVDLAPARICQCKNAEVRREFVRKVGLDRIYHALGAMLIHEQTVTLATPYSEAWSCRYRLCEMRCGDNVRRRVLEMPNPSLPGVLHVEYVPVQCETVEQAMNFRLNRSEEDVDDDAGADWFLHGDVIIVPEQAGRLKRWPARIA